MAKKFSKAEKDMALANGIALTVDDLSRTQPVYFSSGVLEHVNEQIFGASAADDIAEAIGTPGYDGSNGGMALVAAYVRPKAEELFMCSSTQSEFVTQIQLGNREGTPAPVECNEVGFFAESIIQARLLTTGGYQMKWPQTIPVLKPDPYITTQHLTIFHVGDADAQMNLKTVYVVMHYRTAIFHESIANRLLRNQQRIS